MTKKVINDRMFEILRSRHDTGEWGHYQDDISVNVLWSPWCSLYPVFTAVACVAPVAASTAGHAGALLYLATLDMCQEDLLEFRYLMADIWQ